MVIARFDRLVTLCFLFLLFAFAAACIVVANAIGWKDLVSWACVFFALGLVLYAFVVLRQFAFHRQRAVWIENEKLCFLEASASFETFSPYYVVACVRRIPLNSIAEVMAEPTPKPAGSKQRGVFVRLKSGGSYRVPTFLLSDPPEVVLTRLREALGFAPSKP